jgi:heterodisulfide reductase subunit D
MKLTTNIEEIRPAIFGCLKCNECTYGSWPENYIFCPLYERGRTFTASAGGLLYLEKAILNGQLDYTKELADLAFTCATCSACDGQCVIVRCDNPNMALSDYIRLLRYELVKRGIIPEGPIKKMYEQVKKDGDFSGNGLAKTPIIPESVLDGKADTLFVATCMHNKATVKVYEAAGNLLKKMNKRVALFADDGCCGSTLYDFGFWDQLPALVEKKWEKISSFGKRYLLFVDPHCQEFMTNKYEKIIDGFSGFEGKHFSELLVDAFKKGKLTSKNNAKKIKVSYHDPCFLGRGLGIYEPPRQVLGFLKGVEFVEMKRNREQSFCCGARALGTYFKDFSVKTAKERIREFLDTKADVLITACPHCKEIFQKVVSGGADRIKDLSEFVAERVV